MKFIKKCTKLEINLCQQSSELLIDFRKVLNYNIDKTKSSKPKGGMQQMTDMRRVTISLPEDIDKRILRLKKTNKFVRESYSEIVRQLLLKGLEKEMKDKAS
jgi:hypothetical protein